MCLQRGVAMADQRFWTLPEGERIFQLMTDMGDGTHAIRYEIYPAKKFLTDNDGAAARLRVDVGQTGFFAGREFRSFYEYSIPSGQSVVLKFSSPTDFILFQQTLTVDAGSVKYTAELGGTEGGVFTPLPVIGKNRMASRPQPYYAHTTSISAGGTLTGGTIVDVARVVTSGSTAQQTTVGLSSDERGLPAGNYYIRLSNFGNGVATGVYYLFWEERV